MTPDQRSWAQLLALLHALAALLWALSAVPVPPL